MSCLDHVTFFALGSLLCGTVVFDRVTPIQGHAAHAGGHRFDAVLLCTRVPKCHQIRRNATKVISNIDDIIETIE